ncbi:RecQ family ATP-dependent DNA helicase [Vagococcus vulneris]|uniref:ATP-dependent DNA helicase RecQ n=1 Tax=Vagococcus vulneris TaxID=1977869 RepID=A0A430A212_9ENTE|nr:ATP-dependent DNA helicase RecQ [Vagococcus vulneris]RSU00452.1 hypothetical protein CBF37_00115 [Vagococcus vulneris]
METELSLTTILKENYGFDEFRPGQEEVISNSLSGLDTLAVLPTGSGKSLIYQFVSDESTGQTLIISPLISLMADQVAQLRGKGEKSIVALNSQLSFNEKKFVIGRLSEFKYIFMSPEMLNKPEVLKKLISCQISLFVVDEAHCISQWGNDFRPDYLQLKHILQELGYPKVMALTATAAEDVIEDIKQQIFSFRDVASTILSVDRPNIYYSVRNVESKIDYLIDFIRDYQTTGIIYFSSKKEADRIAEILNQHTEQQVAAYHGGMTNEERFVIQQQFIRGDIAILCATNAFGMGVNKTDIRFVIHYHLPDSLENYAQEVGRAGRDGQQSIAVLLYDEGDERIHQFLQEDSYQQKADLLFLKDKKSAELKKLLPILTDFQLKWYQLLIKSDWDWEKFSNQIEVRRQQQQFRLFDIKDFVKSTHCRRGELLHYFNQDPPENLNQTTCCDNCYHTFPKIRKNENVTYNHRLVSYKDIVKKLFLL